jgi:hypothetical protein
VLFFIIEDGSALNEANPSLPTPTGSKNGAASSPLIAPACPCPFPCSWEASDSAMGPRGPELDVEFKFIAANAPVIELVIGIGIGGKYS